MPAKQQGAIIKRGTRSYQARWRDESGKQHGRGGFETRTAAREWLNEQIDEVHALRRGDAILYRTARRPLPLFSTPSRNVTAATSTRRRSERSSHVCVTRVRRSATVTLTR